MNIDEFDYIYLSPHLDDAIFSCGSQIYKHTSLGRSVLIITAMAGEPEVDMIGDFAQGLHKRWGLGSDAVAIRRNEDLMACAHIGAKVIHWPYLDCIYRRNPQSGKHLYRTDPELFGPIDSSDSELISALSKQLDALPTYSKVLAPLAVGNHVDHQIIRQVATKVLDANRLYFYEEFPYVFKDVEQLLTVEQNIDWKAEIINITPDDLAARIKAMSYYRSQLSTFFTDEQELHTRVTEYVTKVGGERIWHQELLDE